ncbi:hypothetical protein KIW84_041534 [Lathyrus oleraceus]|uniref:Uncharacterized protein n=1 Tax=Pisum sativum TaxID=3888 RepID=A0A9D4XAF2_PEA|nr:hypothetical protein KIW84_041534 [Pisum sativum]
MCQLNQISSNLQGRLAVQMVMPCTFEDSKSVAEAAVESSEKAIAAADMAMKDNSESSQPYYNDKCDNDPAKHSQNMTHKSATKDHCRPNFCYEEIETEPPPDTFPPRSLHSVAIQLRKHSKSLGKFGAWNKCLNHVLALAESHMESEFLAKFTEAVQSYPDPSAQNCSEACLWPFMRWIEYGMTLEPTANVDYAAPNKQNPPEYVESNPSGVRL